jgi:hypothetical protein
MKKLLINYFFRRFTGNYGVLGWLDYLHGTDENFRKSESFKKHKLLIPFITSKIDVERDENGRKTD